MRFMKKINLGFIIIVLAVFSLIGEHLFKPDIEVAAAIGQLKVHSILSLDKTYIIPDNFKKDFFTYT